MVRDEQLARLESNKVLAQRFHLEIVQGYDLALADEIIAPDCVFHSPRGINDLRGPARARASAIGERKRYPNGVQFEHSQILAEGDLLAYRWVARGVLESGETLTTEGNHLIRIDSDKIAEVWVGWGDVLGFQQLLAESASDR